MKLKNNKLYLLFKSCRPKQWLKNLALFAPLIFSGFLFDKPAEGPAYFYIVLYAVGIFSLLTSSIYLINDVLDKKADSQHPFKKNRPIASGKISVAMALSLAIVQIILVYLLSMTLNPFFKYFVTGYLALQILYSLKLKQLAIFDIISIALGFLIRIYAGAVVVDLHMSVWFLLTIISASLFMAVAKRQSERTLMANSNLAYPRKSLEKYSQRLLDQYTAMFATTTWLTYALFAFQNQTGVASNQLYEKFPNIYFFLPRSLQSQKLLMLTIPFMIFGVMRYLQLIYEENKGENPADVLLKDKTILVTAILGVLSVIVLIYA
jgi:4-hydroxybenzoate polyprenyltransferase